MLLAYEPHTHANAFVVKYARRTTTTSDVDFDCDVAVVVVIVDVDDDDAAEQLLVRSPHLA